MITLFPSSPRLSVPESFDKKTRFGPISRLVERELYLKIVPASSLLSSRGFQLIARQAYDGLMNGLSSTLKTEVIFTSLFSTISVTKSLCFDPRRGEIQTLLKVKGELHAQYFLTVRDTSLCFNSSQIEQALFFACASTDLLKVQSYMFILQERFSVSEKLLKKAIMLAALEDGMSVVNFLLSYQEKFLSLDSGFFQKLLILLINSNQLEIFALVLEKAVQSNCLSHEEMLGIAYKVVVDASKDLFLEKMLRLEAFREGFLDLEFWVNKVISYQDPYLLKIIIPLIFEKGENVSQLLDHILTDSVTRLNATNISLIFNYPGMVEKFQYFDIAKLICLAIHSGSKEMGILIYSYYYSLSTEDFFDQLFLCAIDSNDGILKNVIDFYEPVLTDAALLSGLSKMIELESINISPILIQVLFSRNILELSTLIEVAFIAIKASNITVFNELFHLSAESNQKLSSHLSEFLFYATVNNKNAFFEYFLITLFTSPGTSLELIKEMYNFLLLALKHKSYAVALCILDFDQSHNILSVFKRATIFKKSILEDHESIVCSLIEQPWFHRVLDCYCQTSANSIKTLQISEIRKALLFLNSQDVPVALLSVFSEIFIQSIFSNRKDIINLFMDENNFADLIKVCHFRHAFIEASRFHSVKCMQRIIDLTKKRGFAIQDDFFDGVLENQVQSGSLQRVEFICLQVGYTPCHSDLQEMARYAHLLGFNPIASFLRNLLP